MAGSPQQINQQTASSLLFFFGKLLHAKPYHASGYIITSWFAIALDAKIKN